MLFGGGVRVMEMTEVCEMCGRNKGCGGVGRECADVRSGRVSGELCCLMGLMEGCEGCQAS